MSDRYRIESNNFRHITTQLFEFILKERSRQDEKWGSQRNHTDLYWLGVLIEEVGEVGKSLIEHKDFDHTLEELVQCMAVIFCWIENRYNIGSEGTEIFQPEKDNDLIRGD